ncbi:bifunctional serine/threonine-protein kinase/universal stress protein [Microbacteriaceae bacterium K1510]|nr:bifunctional serine/threonine-protein kinase/universal stress protein [Microbacteriaceae bacterium K1510]
MVKPLLTAGSIIDGFRLEAAVHRGGMATLWRVTRDGIDTPMLMKVPHIAEGADPAAVVSFEMEQMILPRLSGPHVPKCFGVGDFALQPYIVMEQIPGQSLLSCLGDLPLPYAEVVDIGAKIATALDDLHRQHVVHLDIKPSNIVFRATGEAVLLDYGLSHHEQLPDLMQEEFRVPFGTAPYMSPEQLRDIRNDPRSDLFALGVLLYFFSTGVRPFGESESLRGMRRRLWRDPRPPRQLRKDYPLWLQEIVLKCLEIEPAWRYPTAAQLIFELTHPDQVKLTQRAERLKRDPWTVVLRRRFNTDLKTPRGKAPVSAQLHSAPIVAVAVDLEAEPAAVNDALRLSAQRLLAMLPSARLACLNVRRLGRIALDTTLDEQGHSKQIDRLVGLRHWAAPLKLDEQRLTVHVLEAVDPAAAILEFAENNRVDHILIGARQASVMRKLLGSVSAKVAAEATCSVTVVRPRRPSPL